MMKRRRVQGFSLIEVLFSVFLVVVCASIVAATMPMAANSHAVADHYNKALNLAQKQLETITRGGFANATPDQLLAAGLIDSENSVAANTYPFTNSDSTSRDNPGLVLHNGTGTVCVQQLDIDLTQVIVTVSWSERNGSHSVQLGTLIANL